ncbi:tetratricopeptide repeat protein [Leptospira sp. GIMC2001]|uniref:tetratricopeptide repeat protein n=1 Tax=Leptospira sp. GIMC2001 TaxID=1513297 RepID=UPI002348F28D|nr:tetratricopeptide repeat protein [Leptospira sp. GIMC2001]WCL50201.1 tetratricopeptide repeat protein [Leptospira sp. GIMC2001]
MKLSIQHLIIVSILGLIVNCSSREFRTTKDSGQSVKATLSPEEKVKYDRALQIVNQGNREFQKSNFKESLKLATTALENFPVSEGYYLAGVSNYKMGKNEEAASDLEVGRKIDPKNEQILITLALVKSTLGDEESSLEIYNELIQFYPEEPIYSFRKGIQEKGLGKYTESLTTFKSINPEKFPQKTELYSQLGDVSMKLKNYKEAENYFALAEKNSPDSKSLKANTSSVKTASYLEKGNNAMASKNYDIAVAEYSKAVKNEPKNASPLVFLANAQILQSDYRGGEANLNKALQLNDEFVPAYEAYSALFYREKKYPQSLTWAVKGLKVAPKSEALWNRQGLAQWKMGDNKSAALSFRKATEINPKFMEAERNLGFLLIEEKRFRNAKLTFNNLITRDPSNAEQHKKTALFCDQLELIEKGDRFLPQGKIRDAKREYDKALTLNQEEPAVWNAFGRMHFIEGNSAKTVSSYNRSLTIDNDNIPALQGMIRHYSKSKDKAKEKFYLARLEKLTEGDATTGILIGRLKEDSGDLAGAEKTYLDLRKKFPDDDAVPFRLGVLYYKMAVEKNTEEKYDEALSYLKKAEKENPNLPDIAETERVIKENRKFDEVLPTIRKANTLYDRKKFKEASALYNEAFVKSGKPNLLVKVAECMVGMGEEEKAMSLLENAAKNNKGSSSDFQEAMYSFLLQKGEVEKAEKGFYKILSENEGSFYSYYKLGLIEMGRKNYDKSISLLDKSLILNYNFPAGNVAKGVVYYRKGDPKVAKEEFDRAMEKDDGLDIASYNIGILFFNQSMDKEARKVFQELAKKNPDFAESYHQLSYLDFKEGKIASAEKNILKALDIERTPAHLFAYARILEAKKDSNRWKSVARELTENYPSSQYAAKLKAAAFKDEPIYFQNHGIQGTLASDPIFVGDMMIANYGSSIVATNSASKTRIWRSQVNENYQHLATDMRLYGVSSKSITSWNLEDGEIAGRKEHGFPKDAKFVFSTNTGDEIILAYQSSTTTVFQTWSYELDKKKEVIVPGSWNFVYNSVSQKILAWNKTNATILFDAKDTDDLVAKATNSSKNSKSNPNTKKPLLGSWIGDNAFLIFNNGYMNSSSSGDFKSWKTSFDRAKVFGDSAILSNGNSFYSWNGNGEPTELSFAKGAKDVLPVDDGFIVWKSNDSAFYYDKLGKAIADTKVPQDWKDRRAEVSSLYIQALNRSK